MKYLTFLLIVSIANGFIKIGHRGAAGHEPENTLKSFQKALDLKVDMIELDVHKTKDSKLVVIHDDTLDRTANSTGVVSERTLEQLKKLDAGGLEKIPTLGEVIKLVDRQVPLNIELKGKGVARLVADLIKKYLKLGWEKRHFIVSSFDHEQLEEFHKYLPDIALGKLIKKNLSQKDLANLDGVRFIGIGKDYLDSSTIDLVHKKNIKVYVFTVNEDKDIKNIISMGIDGIFSDFPDRL